MLVHIARPRLRGRLELRELKCLDDLGRDRLLALPRLPRLAEQVAEPRIIVLGLHALEGDVVRARLGDARQMVDRGSGACRRRRAEGRGRRQAKRPRWMRA